MTIEIDGKRQGQDNRWRNRSRWFGSVGSTTKDVAQDSRVALGVGCALVGVLRLRGGVACEGINEASLVGRVPGLRVWSVLRGDKV